MKEVKRYLLDTYLGEPVLVTKTELGFLKIERYMDDDSEVVLSQDFDAVVKELQGKLARLERIEAAANALVGGPGAVVECNVAMTRAHVKMDKFNDLSRALMS